MVILSSLRIGLFNDPFQMAELHGANKWGVTSDHYVSDTWEPILQVGVSGMNP